MNQKPKFRRANLSKLKRTIRRKTTSLKSESSNSIKDEKFIKTLKENNAID